MNANTNPATSTFKAPLPKESQHVSDANAVPASSTLSCSLDSGDPSRKKSGFVITRIDKASISSALENESDMENEFCNDRGGAGNRSPGSSSVISESSSIFDDAVSPEKATVLRIALHGATPVISPCPARPSGFPPPPDLKPLNANLVNVLEQESLGVNGLSPSSAASSGKDTSSSASTSRFRIIKIDTGPYKRGRWSCKDFDESCSNGPSSAARSDMIAVGGPRSGSSNGSSGKQSYFMVEENGRSAAGGDGQQSPLLLLATAVVGNAIDHNHNRPISPSIGDSHQHRPLSPLPNDHPVGFVIHQQTAPGNSNEILLNHGLHQSASPSINNASPQQMSMASTNKFPASSGVDLNNAAAAILDSIMVGRIQQQGDQFRTSASSQGDNPDAASIVGSLQSVGDVTASVIVQNSGSTSTGGTSAAIDNKIEQAMDLVKTHLLYAVREEVEVLKEKIIDLERKVFRLETENKLLREYAPPEILQQIQQSGVGQTVSSFLSSPATTQQQSVISPSSPHFQAITAPAVFPAILASPTAQPAATIPGSDGGLETTIAVSPSLHQQPPPAAS